MVVSLDYKSEECSFLLATDEASLLMATEWPWPFAGAFLSLRCSVWTLLMPLGIECLEII